MWFEALPFLKQLSKSIPDAEQNQQLRVERERFTHISSLGELRRKRAVLVLWGHEAGADGERGAN